MCGIAGIISKNKDVVDKQLMQNAMDCMQHRGPENEGLWMNDEQTVLFGHRRLSIIDVSNAASQPMHFGGRYTIIHNGELYNYLEIKEQLKHKGYRFFSQSDTEVIVAAYDCWGNKCLQQFDGMFAFAIWDEKEKILFAARDRFGEKPFFFFYDEERFVFASELKALWRLGVKKEVNKSLLYNFLTIGYTGNPAEPQETFYEHIHKLPAASFLHYSLTNHQLTIEKYWQVNVDVNNSITEENAIEQFKHLFSDSIKKRLRSDVAIGTSLSGGLDSSAIVAFCDEETTANYSHKCFTASFKGFEKDETAFAKTIAKQFQLQHFIVAIDEENIVELMTNVMQKQEEPFGSASVLAQYKVYETAKENGVTVLLDGQGADEILAGYHKYYKWYWQELYRNKKLSNELKLAKQLGVTETFSIKNKFAALLPQFAAGILEGRKAKQAFNDPALNRDFAFANKKNLYYTLPASFDLNGALYFNTFVNGLEELLRLADRNSMAHSTEVRLPFLSYELVQFLFTLPPNFKINNGWTKWLLRKSVEKKLPSEIVWRKDKVGFEPPQKMWMENKKVQEAIMHGKKKLVENEILNPSVLKKTQPHTAYAAVNNEWKYWSASFLFD